MPYGELAVQCPYNEGVSCKDTGNCGNCGWNEDVAAERAIRILAGIGIYVEME